MKVKAIIKKINPKGAVLDAEFVEEFLDDIVRHEGKTVTLHNFNNDEEQYFSYTLKSENGIDWHQSGSGSGKGMWSGGEVDEVFNSIFYLLPDVEPLDEDLFKI